MQKKESKLDAAIKLIKEWQEEDVEKRAVRNGRSFLIRESEIKQ